MKKRVFFFVLFLCFASFGFLEAEEPVLYLTSKEDVSLKFIEKVKKESQCIRMASHRLSDPAVVQALMEAHQRKVSVELIVDSTSLTKNTPLKRLLEEGVPVFVWQTEKLPKKKSEAPRRLRHAFCVFGADQCWIGSYSFSLKRRFRPFESVLLLQDEKIAKELLMEFEEIKKEYTISLFSYLKQREVS